jgi:hypothetical protein
MRPENGRQSLFVRRCRSLWILQPHEGGIPVQWRPAVQGLCIKQKRRKAVTTHTHRSIESSEGKKERNSRNQYDPIRIQLNL